MTDGSDIDKGYPPISDGDPETTEHRGMSKDRARLYAGAVIGALLTAFALLNLDDVKVHWLVGTSHTPLFIVIVIAFLCGLAVDRLIVRAQRRRTKVTSASD
jgi:uncharacterized integral membrane protein